MTQRNALEWLDSWLEEFLAAHLSSARAASTRPGPPDHPPRRRAPGRVLSHTYTATTDSPVYVVDARGERPLVIHPEWTDRHGWGYVGRSPHQLSLDILWDVRGERPDETDVVDFLHERIVGLPRRGTWYLPAQVVGAWLAYREEAPGVRTT